jgi:EAL domain-containing protein (putative c-di-GMP-specific phosphodiesterase class I)
VGKQRTDAEQQIAELLRTAKRCLRLDVAFLTRMDATTQHLEVVESDVPLPIRDGRTQRRETSFCQAILDGRLPAVIPDVTAFPVARAFPAVRLAHIRSFVSVPVVLSDGTVYGTFCAAGSSPCRELAERDRSLLGVLAAAAAVIVEPGAQERSRRSEIEARLGPVLAAGGPVVALQPIIALATGVRVGAEALSRFPADWQRAPDVCFAEAHRVGRGHRLELLALERAAEHLGRVSGYVAMNVSPVTLLQPECARLLDRLPLERILLELSEQYPVGDYQALKSVLAPLRGRGMRLAIDDVGAGFSSLRHIVLTAPDVIKLDRSIVHGVSTDPVLATLVAALVQFGRGSGAQLVAEGIETAADAAALLGLGVDLGQGWHFGRPGPPEKLAERVPATTLSLPAQRPAAAGRSPARAGPAGGGPLGR